MNLVMIFIRGIAFPAIKRGGRAYVRDLYLPDRMSPLRIQTDGGGAAFALSTGDWKRRGLGDTAEFAKNMRVVL